MVIGITWYDAVDYTEWLSVHTGQAYRLPTEAEWEYAARAGTETAFWWGDSITTDQANYDGNDTYGLHGRAGRFREWTVPMNHFQPNPWGLYQVHGNVWEWTGSFYDEKYAGAEMQCMDKQDDGLRVVRGGSWVSVPKRLRSAARYGVDPRTRLSIIGFRLARTLTL